MGHQSNFTIVLIEPQDPINIGSVARAMMNLGYSNLRLVSPQNYNVDQALRSACWAEKVISDAQTFNSTKAALADMQLAVGFTARSGKNRPTILLPDWLTASHEFSGRRVALVFGSEDNGLRQSDLAYMNCSVTIPASCAYPCFNLAQAVLIVLYELAKITLVPDTSCAPTLAEFDFGSKMVDEIMQRIQFINQGTPKQVPALVNSMFKRIAPRDEREMQILNGFLGRIIQSLPE